VKTKTGFIEPMISLAVAKLPEGPACSAIPKPATLPRQDDISILRSRRLL
jgi:hypothetical protein